MTAGDQTDENNSDNYQASKEVNQIDSQTEKNDGKYEIAGGSSSTKTAQDVWVETRLMETSRETASILPCCKPSSSKVQNVDLSNQNQERIESRSLQPSSQQSICYGPREQSKEYWGTTFGGHGGGGALNRGRAGGGGGCCAILPDKSIDLIELTTESEIGESSSGLPSIQNGFPSCHNNSKWLFSRHKCKSLDCTNKTTQSVFHKPIINCLSTVESYDKLKNQKPNSEPSIEANSNNISTVYTTGNAACTGNSGASLTRANLEAKIPRSSSATVDLEVFDCVNNEEDFRVRSFSLTPTVNLAIFETESSDEDDPRSSNTFLNRSIEDNPATFFIPTVSVPLLPQTISCSPSAAQLSLASSMTDSGASICKICHMTAKDGDPLISPCRCSGTMQFIHCGCLMRWLEISSKKSRKPPSCELCQYQYHWHKKFKVRHWQFPHCSRHDKILHILFFISVMVMIACATITIMCFKQDKGTKIDPDRTELTESEIVTLVCGVLFFLAFFVAMYVEVKARNTIYKLIVRFVYLNQQWYIDEYEKKESAPVSV